MDLVIESNDVAELDIPYLKIASAQKLLNICMNKYLPIFVGAIVNFFTSVFGYKSIWTFLGFIFETLVKEIVNEAFA